MRYFVIFILFIVLSVHSCVPPVEEPLTEVRIDYNDPVYRAICNYQDSQQLDSILQYVNHRDPSYRYAVAKSFSSFQDLQSLDALFLLLKDSIRKVQIAAAFSLGQIGDAKSENALINAFVRKDTGTVNNLLNSTILEAVGKCGSENSLKAVSTVSTYRKEDDLLLLGQARAIYRFGLRGMISKEGTACMSQFVIDGDYPSKVRLTAANYLYRFRDTDISQYKYQLLRVFQAETDPNITMALALSLGRTGDSQVFGGLMQKFNTEADYRVKCNIIRALKSYPYINSIEFILNTLSNPNFHIANLAGDYLISNGISDDATFYIDYARKNLHWSVRAKVYEAILQHIPTYFSNTRISLRNELNGLIESASDPYEKAAYLRALGGDVSNYGLIQNIGLRHESAVVRTTTVETLGSLLKNPSWSNVYRTNSQTRRAKNEIAQILREAIESGDVGLIGAASSVLSDDQNGFKNLISDASFLDTVRQELELPRDIEAFNALNSAINYFYEDEDIKDEVPGFNHPIDWNIYSGITDSSTAIISTTKGNITLKFFSTEAPGTIVNFADLAMQNYYDDKAFHRVVPNFVIQGGCPRGDGYGSLDYTIRSELGPLYYDKEGIVGMASAGNHTESTQFFITHSPAMHLDGKYTIFAEVIDGMDVVHKIEIGDKIRDVIINK